MIIRRRHCEDVGRDPSEIAITWMTPVIFTTDDANTAEVRSMIEAGGGGEESAGFTIGQLAEVPELIAPHIEAGVDEVIFSFAFGTPDQARELGAALEKAFG